ncbi:hypothetical protein GF406_13075 [candidate division KSB1 bacterium]|nr:hypothetical protein [candidate division KSB1 bacterium]
MRSGLVLFLVAFACFCRADKDVRVETIAVKPESGFRMDGYFVWGGSAIKVNDTYHLFASRWPDHTEFPRGYRRHSEIVRATSTDPLGPYNFEQVVIDERAPGYWDSDMAHNPTIHRFGDDYILFYIGSDKDSVLRQIGYAVAKEITGPWQRSATPLEFGQDANNPAVLFEPDGSVKMMWRTRDLQVKIATAPHYSGPYAIVNENVWPEARLEDFYLWKQDDRVHMVCEDNRGEVSGHERWGVRFVSKDGITGWHPLDAPVMYDHTIKFTDGSELHCERRERPQLLLKNNIPTHLFTSVLYNGTTWCQVVPLR